MADRSDWRWMAQDRYLMGARLRLTRYTPRSDRWDHEHSAFCSVKIAQEALPEAAPQAYATPDERHWVCPTCYEDFKGPFGWTASVWNLFHDGSIVGLDGSVPGDVTVTVAIEYLRAMLPEPGDSFCIRLTGCTSLECRPLCDFAAIATAEPEILSASDRGDTVVVGLQSESGTYMELRLHYETITVSVEGARVVPFDELAAAARRYWEGVDRTT